MSKILDGRVLANLIKEKLKQRKIVVGPPRLVAFCFGEDADDLAYRKNISKICEELGVTFSVIPVEDIEDFLSKFGKENEEDTADGIIIIGKIPYPAAADRVRRNIQQWKDVDGFGCENITWTYCGYRNATLPCTVEAVQRLLDFYNIDVAGKRVCIVGRGSNVGRSLAMSLVNRDATVTVCHSKTKDLKEET